MLTDSGLITTLYSLLKMFKIDRRTVIFIYRGRFAHKEYCSMDRTLEKSGYCHQERKPILMSPL